MLIRDSISNTKKFLHKTIHNFKAFFSFPRTDHHHHSPTYKKLPKFEVPGIDAADYEELERFYSGFKDEWDNNRGKKTKGFKNLQLPVAAVSEDDQQQASPKRRPSEFSPVNENRVVASDLQKQRSSSGSSKNISMVAKKLKELEMMDKSNVDHVLDIEEILHYYSRLTCPFYLDVIDNFFMQVVDEFSGISSCSTPAATASGTHKSKERSN